MSEDGTQTFRASTSEPIVVSIVRAVAACTNEPATELTPLYDVVDVDALEALLRRGDPRVEFTYEGCAVTVSPERIRVEPRG